MKQYKDTPYYITEDGKVFRNGKELKFWITKKGYCQCKISYDGLKKHFYLHRLVAELYIPNLEDKSQVNHIDGNKLNNHICNLEWVTNQENRNHAIKNGLHCKGIDTPNNKFTEDDIKYIRKTVIIFFNYSFKCS